MSNKKSKFFKILGISEASTSEEIKKACRELMKKYHPDTCSGEYNEEDFYLAQEIKDYFENVYTGKVREKAKKKEYAQEEVMDAIYEFFTSIFAIHYITNSLMIKKMYHLKSELFENISSVINSSIGESKELLLLPLLGLNGISPKVFAREMKMITKKYKKVIKKDLKIIYRNDRETRAFAGSKNRYKLFTNLQGLFEHYGKNIEKNINIIKSSLSDSISKNFNDFGKTFVAEYKKIMILIEKDRKFWEGEWMRKKTLNNVGGFFDWFTGNQQKDTNSVWIIKLIFALLTPLILYFLLSKIIL